jgi:2-haloacid dehalogenase
VTRQVVLFDLNGTITNPAALGRPWDSIDLGQSVLSLAVQASLVCLIIGRYCDFRDHISCALRLRVAERGLDPSLIDDALEIAAALPPFAEASAALDALSGAGRTLAVLTNSGQKAGRRTLQAARLAPCFERILGVDAVGSFKPHPATYQYALRELRCDPARAVFVTSHRCALEGAAHAGMRTAFVRRGGGRAPVTPRPDIKASDLAGVAAQLLAA